MTPISAFSPSEPLGRMKAAWTDGLAETRQDTTLPVWRLPVAPATMSWSI
jgi:hypothetical protein